MDDGECVVRGGRPADIYVCRAHGTLEPLTEHDGAFDAVHGTHVAQRSGISSTVEGAGKHQPIDLEDSSTPRCLPIAPHVLVIQLLLVALLSAAALDLTLSGLRRLAAG
jgi:hypothetical protein